MYVTTYLHTYYKVHKNLYIDNECLCNLYGHEISAFPHSEVTDLPVDEVNNKVDIY